MHYLRMLTNSAIGGILLAAYLTILLLQLNPALDLHSVSAVPTLLTWALFYGLHAAVAIYALIGVCQILAVEVRSPGWVSFRLLAWLGAGAASTGAALIWMNWRGFRAVLDPIVVRQMFVAAVVVSVCAVVCVVLALAQLSLAHRGRRIGALLFLLVLIVSLVVPVSIRGLGTTPVLRARRLAIGMAPLSPESVPRVAMILLDGASLDFISPAAAQGRLPNFGKLLDSGAVLHLATLRPTHPVPVWTAVATGKLPYKNGVRSAATFKVTSAEQSLELLPDFCFAQALIRFGFMNEDLYASDAMAVRPLWNLLGSFGITTGIVGWPLTYPAPSVHGYLVSDQALRRPEDPALPSLPDESPSVYPPELSEVVRDARLRASPDEDTLTLATAAVASAEAGDGVLESTGPLANDLAYERVAADLQLVSPARFTAVRYQGLDVVGHYYLRYAAPRAFGDVSDDERRRFGRVLEQYYTFVDGIVGRAMDSLGPDGLLFVVSGFGMEPLSLGKRLLEHAVGDSALSGSHERAPDGFLIAYGRQVASGRLSRASVVDIVPTMLYLLGLPVARDMDGYARTDIFTSAFTAQRPITFIPSYDR